jgi:S1-C subfamily serine protease
MSSTRSRKVSVVSWLTVVLCAASIAFTAPSFFAPSHVSAQDRTEARRVRIARRLALSTVSIIAGGATGSGFVVSQERWIITNYHVIEGVARTAMVQVHFGSGTTLSARILEIDQSHDLALLEIAGGHVPSPPLEMADSDDVEVGQEVMAFGSPFGLDGTLTEGIVSARRDVPGVGGGLAHNLIQTDAPINPGNSGGPLVDQRGRVIGVNTAIYSPGPHSGSLGIGFAVPANYVRDFVADVRTRVHGDHGQTVATTSTTPTTTTITATPTTLPTTPASPVFLGVVGEDYTQGTLTGVRVTRVITGSPAQRAGIVGADEPPPALIARLRVAWTGHIITAVDGQPLRTMAELDAYLSTREPGQRVRLSVRLGSGSPLSGDTTVTLEAPR